MLISEKLNDSKNYKVLAKDPTTTNNDLVNQTINRFTKKTIDKWKHFKWIEKPIN